MEVAGADRAEHVPSLDLGGELGSEHGAPDHNQVGVLVGELLADKGHDVRRPAPLKAQARVAAGDHLRVRRDRAIVDTDHRRRVRDGEGIDDALLGATEQRAVVGRQRLHHGQVGPDENEQDRSGFEDPVPDRLQRTLERGTRLRQRLGQPRELVEHHDGCAVWQRRCQTAQRCMPVVERDAVEEVRARERRVPGRLSQPRQLLVGTCQSGRREEQLRQATSNTEGVTRLPVTTLPPRHFRAYRRPGTEHGRAIMGL